MTEDSQPAQGTQAVAEQSAGNLASAAGIDVKAPETPPEGAEGKQDWYVRPDVKGEGEKPDWFVDKQFNTVYDQAKSWKDMRQTVGAFSGAPKEYSLDLGEDYKGKEVNAEDPLLKDFTAFAKNNKMSQEAYTDQIKMFVSYSELQDQRQEKELSEFTAMELEKLGGGEVAKTKIDEMCQWFGQNFPNCKMDDFKDMMYFADAFDIFRSMRDKMSYAKVPSSDTQTFDSTPAHELRELISNPKYLSDPSYQKMVDEKYAAKYGK